MVLSRIKSALFEEDPGEVAAPAPVVAPPPAPPRRFPKPGATVLASSPPKEKPAEDVSLNQEMVDQIRSGVFARATALSALLKASDDLEGIIPDPVMRLKAAQKMVGGGKTAKEFTDAIALHLQDVDAEQKRFNAAVENAARAKVGSLREQQAAAQSIVERSLAELDQIEKREIELNQLIKENGDKATQLETDIETEEAKLNRVEKEFELAAQNVREELNEQKETILSSLS